MRVGTSMGNWCQGKDTELEFDNGGFMKASKQEYIDSRSLEQTEFDAYLQDTLVIEENNRANDIKTAGNITQNEKSK